MTAADLTNPIFSDEEAARAHFEALRWPGSVPICPHCGVVGDAAPIAQDEKRAETRKKAGKKVARKGLRYCRSCKGTFTATTGTVYEDSHIPLNKWMLATHLMNAGKRGVSAAELQRLLGLGSYRTAWFMAHRIREGMGVDKHGEPLGGASQIVEADETYYGHKKDWQRSEKRGPDAGPRKHRKHANRAVVALVERGGKSRVFHVGNADKETVARIITENVHPESRLHTDESRLYTGSEAHVAKHESVKHSGGEYVRGDVHTNSAEGFFSQFKRGMVGVYGHCDEKYLARYVREFEFRHNHRVKLGFNDKERAALAVKGTVGKRLTLVQPKGKQKPA